MIIGEGDLSQIVLEVMRRLELTDHKLTDHKLTVDEATRGISIGLKNVYNKFIELEKKQLEIEELLKSDRLKKILSVIPSEKQINDLLDKIENGNIKKLNRHLKGIKSDLDHLTNIINY